MFRPVCSLLTARLQDPRFCGLGVGQEIVFNHSGGFGYHTITGNILHREIYGLWTTLQWTGNRGPINHTGQLLGIGGQLICIFWGVSHVPNLRAHYQY